LAWATPSWAVTLNQVQSELPRGNFMLNYFGFGGNNTSLVVTNLSEARPT